MVAVAFMLCAAERRHTMKVANLVPTEVVQHIGDIGPRLKGVLHGAKGVKAKP